MLWNRDDKPSWTLLLAQADHGFPIQAIGQVRLDCCHGRMAAGASCGAYEDPILACAQASFFTVRLVRTY